MQREHKSFAACPHVNMVKVFCPLHEREGRAEGKGSSSLKDWIEKVARSVQ